MYASGHSLFCLCSLHKYACNTQIALYFFLNAFSFSLSHSLYASFMCALFCNLFSLCVIYAYRHVWFRASPRSIFAICTGTYTRKKERNVFKMLNVYISVERQAAASPSHRRAGKRARSPPRTYTFRSTHSIKHSHRQIHAALCSIGMSMFPCAFAFALHTTFFAIAYDLNASLLCISYLHIK